MKTTIYLVRHSEVIKNNFEADEAFQIINEKNILSVKGEEKAKKLSEIEELQHIDVVVSSNYVRAMSTAKYVAEANNVEMVIDNNLGERVFGINHWDELPKDYELRQLKEENYKLGYGESRREVAIRMHKALLHILKKYKGKTIFVVSHGTAISCLFMKLFDFSTDNTTYNFSFKGEKFFDGVYNAPELFKLEYIDEELVSILNIKKDIFD